MVIKLKSILKKIPWSLGGRAFGLSALWLLAPYPLFLIAALLVYFKPGASLHKMPEFFAVVLLLTWFADLWLESGINGTHLVAYQFALRIFLALIFGALFFLFLGIRGLLFVRRGELYLFSAALALFLAAFFALWSAEPGKIAWHVLFFGIAAFSISMPFFRISVNSYYLSDIFVYSGVIALLVSEVLWVLAYFSLPVATVSILPSAVFYILNLLYFVRETARA